MINFSLESIKSDEFSYCGLIVLSCLLVIGLLSWLRWLHGGKIMLLLGRQELLVFDCMTNTIICSCFLGGVMSTHTLYDLVDF